MNKETKGTVEKIGQKELIEKELIILTDQKAKMVAQVNQLQQSIENGKKNLSITIDAHNRTQAQIDILQKILKSK